jgi:hypothetical protein
MNRGALARATFAAFVLGFPSGSQAADLHVGPSDAVSRQRRAGCLSSVVVSIPSLRARDGALSIDYVLRASVDDGVAVWLILDKLLSELLFDRYREKAQAIELRNAMDGSSWRIPYPYVDLAEETK